MTAFRIDISEQFPHLSKAPIVEAVIELRGNATRPWKEDVVLKTLADELPDYEASERGLKSTVGVTQKISDDGVSLSTEHRSEWTGFRFRHRNQPYLGQFRADGFFLSRLQPYENWDAFVEEALRLWHLHQEIVKIEELARIGVRFLNVLKIPFETQLSEYLRHAPTTPNGLSLPYLGFLYGDYLKVPESPYTLTLNRTVQPDPKGEPFFGLIVDIDVGTDEATGLDEAMIRNRLNEMHWLKNKAFFGTLTDTRIEELR